MPKMSETVATMRTHAGLCSVSQPAKLLAPSMLEITLYTKDNCSLCLKAKRVLQDFQQRHDFRLMEVDVTTDETLYERYKHDVPVATWNGAEIFRHRIDTKTFETFLKERIETL